MHCQPCIRPELPCLGEILHWRELQYYYTLTAKHTLLHNAGKRRRGIRFTLVHGGTPRGGTRKDAFCSRFMPLSMNGAMNGHGWYPHAGDGARRGCGDVIHCNVHVKRHTEHDTGDRYLRIAGFCGETAIVIPHVLIGIPIKRNLFLHEFGQREVHGDALGSCHLCDVRSHGCGDAY